MDRPKVEIEEPGNGFSRVAVTFPEAPAQDAIQTVLGCAARLREASSIGHLAAPQGVDPGVLDFEAGVLERLADRLAPGDIAALRGALEGLLSALEAVGFQPLVEGDPLAEAVLKARAALSAPPRNCDNYETPDEAWYEYANTHRGTSDRSWKSLILFARWLFAPEGGKEASNG